jgi:hypothetical protein
MGEIEPIAASSSKQAILACKKHNKSLMNTDILKLKLKIFDGYSNAFALIVSLLRPKLDSFVPGIFAFAPLYKN